MGLLDGIVDRLSGRQTSIADEPSLARFLDSRSAFTAQKCITEFCRVRAGVHWEKLFRERAFEDALLASTWGSYTPVLAMMTELVEGALRPAAGVLDGRVRARLIDVANGVRNAMTLPPQADAGLWKSQSEMVAGALARAAMAAPRPVRYLPEPLARNVFESLPLHESVVAHDDDYIFNNLRMNLLRAHEDFVAAADLPALVRSLTQ